MSGRHRARPSKSNLLIGSITASVGVSSVLSAAIVELVAPDEPTAMSRPAPQIAAEQSLAQQGRLIAISADSLTTQSVDGSIQTYTITPNTTAITGNGQTADAATSFAVNDEVAVVGARRGDTFVATAVADKAAVGPTGPPMDFGL